MNKASYHFSSGLVAKMFADKLRAYQSGRYGRRRRAPLYSDATVFRNGKDVVIGSELSGHEWFKFEREMRSEAERFHGYPL